MRSFVIQGNLAALFRADAWSVGVLIVVLVGQLHRSPFSSKPDLKRAEFTQDRASLNDIECLRLGF